MQKYLYTEIVEAEREERLGAAGYRIHREGLMDEWLPEDKFDLSYALHMPPILHQREELLDATVTFTLKELIAAPSLEALLMETADKMSLTVGEFIGGIERE
jgi:hypothetical protein